MPQESTIKRTKALFLPHGKGHPYIERLVESLSVLGIDVLRPSCKIFFLLKAWQSDLVHLHWLNIFYCAPARQSRKAAAKLAIFLLQLILVRIRSIPIVWTIHNLRDHEDLHPRIRRICSRAVAGLARSLIVHSEWATGEIIREFGPKIRGKTHVIPCGNFISSYPNTISRQAARKALGIPMEKILFLFLGTIRPYKGIDRLINDFRRLNTTNVQLLICGWAPDAQTVDAVRRMIGDAANILFKPGFVEESQVQIYFNASDVAVFSFEEIFTSASVILAMSFGKPCIVPSIGCIPENIGPDGAFFYDPKDKDGLLHAFNHALRQSEQFAGMGEANKKRAMLWDWESIARSTIKAYDL
jgi:glycosyltransferase involved in cell wall biosynthesis